jgi:hypothetical protein
VHNKLILLSIDELPFKCRVNIRKCIGFPSKIDNGGYIVHPLPAPCGLKLPAANCSVIKEQGSNQNPKLLSLGNAISEVIICKGTIKFPNPPNKIGITAKKIIIMPCIVTTT